jgi:dihydroorotate dehydrogenase
MFDRETLHNVAGMVLRNSLFKSWARKRNRDIVYDPRLNIIISDMMFSNPLCIAAGFDKNGTMIDGLSSIGFGCVEVGTITYRQRDGAPRPRIIMKNDILFNRVELPSDGILRVAPRLNMRTGNCIIGVNIWGHDPHIIDIADHLIGKLGFDYVTINMSCPIVDGERFDSNIQDERIRVAIRNFTEINYPVFVKLGYHDRAGDLGKKVDWAINAGFTGFVVINTISTRLSEKIGGDYDCEMSGRPIYDHGVAMVKDIYRITEGRMPIIGVGGVRTAGNFLKYIRNGASAVQALTGFVTSGPSWPGNILRETRRRMDKSGITFLKELIGVDVK